MWTLGIRDKHLLGKIKRTLKAPIKMPNGQLIYPTKGTPQSGIISPLLANIVLNRIFCRTKTATQKTKFAITQWLSERLKLEVSQEKTRVVNVKRSYCEFLGFKIKVHSKSGKQVVKSHISDKQFKRKLLLNR